MRVVYPLRFSRGTVLVEGPRFDFAKVFGAYEAFIDRLAARFMTTAFAMPKPEQPEVRYAWPDPGKAEMRRWWMRASGRYDAAPVATMYDVGMVCVSAYLLGRTGCLYLPTTGEITGVHGEEFDQLDWGPCLMLFGRRTGIVQRAMLDVAALDAIQETLAGPRDPAPLAMHRVLMNRNPDAPAKRWYGCVYFPHETYGIGDGAVRVRCEMPNGEAVPDSPGAGN